VAAALGSRSAGYRRKIAINRHEALANANALFKNPGTIPSIIAGMCVAGSRSADLRMHPAHASIYDEHYMVVSVCRPPVHSKDLSTTRVLSGGTVLALMVQRNNSVPPPPLSRPGIYPRYHSSTVNGRLVNKSLSASGDFDIRDVIDIDERNGDSRSGSL
jgi:hypothetical protein